MIRNGYAINVTHHDGHITFLDTLGTAPRAQALAEYAASTRTARRVSWGPVRDGGFFPVASAVVPERV